MDLYVESPSKVAIPKSDSETEGTNTADSQESEREYEMKPVSMIKSQVPRNLDQREPLPAGWSYMRHKSSILGVESL